MRLSVVLAVHNEEEHLLVCLKSVKDWCDEIVVVDGSSTDKTVEIAKQFGARVLIADNPPLFHINKQKAIDAAEGDWILQLDADEQVTPELKTEINTALQQNELNGFWIPRKNYFLGRFLMKGGVYPDYTLRLYRRGKGKLPHKDVHEHAVVEEATGYLIHPLIHMSDTTFAKYWLKHQRYTDFLARQYREQRTSVSPITTIENVIVQPIYWFLLTFFRHKGFLDLWQGFLFSFFSALRYPIGYLKYVRNKITSRTR